MAEKVQELELQQAVHRLRSDEGVRSLRALAWMRLERVNTIWPDAIGDELLQLQGEARSLRKIIRMIDDGPAIKETI